MAVQSKSAIRNDKVQQANDMINKEVVNEHLETMMRKFKNQCKKSGILDDYKMHQYYMTKKERKALKEKLNRFKK